MRTCLLACLAITAACADEIAPADDPDAGGEPPGRVDTVRNPDGTYTTTLDATAADAWTVVDLETGLEAGEDAPWDLAVQRFHLKLNGGTSGDGGVEVAPVDAAGLDEVTAIPTSGWITDQADGDDEDAEPDYAFEQGDGWYAYDPETHVLTPRDLVWVLRTVEGSAVAIDIEAYYDDAGTAGILTLRWAPLGGAP